MRRRQYDRYIDSEGFVHASGAAIAVNSGLCGNNDWYDESDEPVNCNVCLAVDKHVRARAALDLPAQATER